MNVSKCVMRLGQWGSREAAVRAVPPMKRSLTPSSRRVSSSACTLLSMSLSTTVTSARGRCQFSEEKANTVNVSSPSSSRLADTRRRSASTPAR